MAKGTIKDQVAIIGMGCTKFGENWDMSTDDMMIDAAFEAFDHKGLPKRAAMIEGPTHQVRKELTELRFVARRRQGNFVDVVVR